MERNALKELEDWVNAEKGRYVSNICIGNNYGTCCWDVTLGNVDIRPGKDWHKSSDWAKKYNRAEIYVSETNFIGGDGELPPNVAVVVDGDEMKEWPGLEKTILTALDKAKELKL